MVCIHENCFKRVYNRIYIYADVALTYTDATVLVYVVALFVFGSNIAHTFDLVYAVALCFLLC